MPLLQAILTIARGSPRAELSVTLILLDADGVFTSLSDNAGFENNPSHSFIVGPTPCGQGGSTVFKTAPAKLGSVSATTEVSKASSRINVTDNSALGLPRAVVRMACSKGTYVRAFARDLGEALGSGAHLDSLQRSASGIFRVENSLTVEQVIDLLNK